MSTDKHTRLSNTKKEQLKTKAKHKYKEVGDKWVINTDHKCGTVRPIDLMGDPDEERQVLRTFDNKPATIAFEMECFEKKERLMNAGEDWSMYRYIQRKKLNITQDQEALVNEMWDIAHRQDESNEARQHST